jgi:CelD/BcsL family acetyltransferase involved in cellulose biosynthesis
LLVDREDAENVIRTFFRFFCDSAAPGHGVEFEYRVSKSPQADWIASVAEEVGATWQESERTQRAIFIPPEGGEKYIQEHLTHEFQKTIQRRRRRMDEMGEVRWKALFGADVNIRNVDSFLEIEHMGWKATNGTSLRSNPSHELFFREVTDNFRKKGDIYFTELSINGVVISSTSNFISGGTGFAFKIGWHPEYARMSPGILNEVEYIRHAPELLRELSCIDSGAEEGSYIDQLWVRRNVLTSGIYGVTPIGKKVLTSIKRMKRMRLWYRGQVTR